MTTTPDVRRRIYLAVAALMPVLVAFGAVAPEAAGLWLALVQAVLSLGASILALRHLTLDGLAAFRAAAYGVVAAAAAAFATIGVVLPGGPDLWLICIQGVVGLAGALLAESNVPTNQGD